VIGVSPVVSGVLPSPFASGVHCMCIARAVRPTRRPSQVYRGKRAHLADLVGQAALGEALEASEDVGGAQPHRGARVERILRQLVLLHVARARDGLRDGDEQVECLRVDGRRRLEHNAAVGADPERPRRRVLRQLERASEVPAPVARLLREGLHQAGGQLTLGV